MSALPFDQPAILSRLVLLDRSELDALDFGVIAFDASGIVQQYNRYESNFTGLSRDNVIGQHVFTTIAQCMNNFLVAQRFENADLANEALDDTIDYVLTWRMRPTKVRLRMVSEPGASLRCILVLRVA
jgi:photoactive yellow protein